MLGFVVKFEYFNTNYAFNVYPPKTTSQPTCSHVFRFRSLTSIEQEPSSSISSFLLFYRPSDLSSTAYNLNTITELFATFGSINCVFPGQSPYKMFNLSKVFESLESSLINTDKTTFL